MTDATATDLSKDAAATAAVALVLSGKGPKAKTTRTGHKRVEVTKTRPDGSTYTAERSVRIARATGEEI